MKCFVKILSIILVIGSSYGKVAHHHHHHQPAHYHGHRGYTTVLTSGPVVAKSAPLVLSKGVPAAAPVQYYSTAPVVHSHASPAGYYNSAPAHVHAHAAPAAAGYYSSAPAGYYNSAPAYAYNGAPLQEHVALLSTAGKPKVYGQSIPAAAIRNVETVMVTKTITPVVTKTTTHHTRAEPALSLGHVQGYSQSAVGHPKVAPVKFQTAYTSYSNPTVGVNGPVVYAGPAVAAGPVSQGVVVPQPVVKNAVAYSPGAYSYLPGTALSLSSYGADAHSVPVANFLELRSGSPVYGAAVASQPLYQYKK
ncbi:hypothetical protein Ocin01_00611 [Orchesella cincta]|uniref:Uncharacterized protein n=1 Tax=Orchesella cincta TaxID=48709 RepID=A0A1D2NLD0_ORCCI|nr:hypothetical protein Ocin01_00611 [Orchesella cincta]